MQLPLALWIIEKPTSDHHPLTDYEEALAGRRGKVCSKRIVLVIGPLALPGPRCGRGIFALHFRVGANFF